MAKRLSRAEVPVELTWNLDDLFPSAEAWEAELAAVEADIPKVAAYKGRLGEGSAVLLECLDTHEAFFVRMMRVATYANLRSSEEGTNTANQANSARVGALWAKAGAAMSYVRPEILSLPEGTIERYLGEEPGLASLRKFLLDLAEEKPHTLSAETEGALAALSEITGSPSTIFNRAKATDMQFDSFFDGEGNELPNSFASYENVYETHPSVDVRRKAWASFVKGLIPYKNTFAATFATEIKKHVVMAKLRKYESATHMLLHPHQVTLEMYNNILDVIQKELAPHFQRYARLRKRVLGLDKLLYCDIKAPIDPAFSPKVTYAEASDMILEALSVLGEEYTDVIRRALSERWIDLADNVGKATGAFCSSPYGVHPYILNPWSDSMEDAICLAHELGHAGHFALAQKYQRAYNTRPSSYFVEAPSTLNELLLGQQILAKSNDVRMKRWVITQMLGTYHHNFITHLLEGELQRRLLAMAEKGQPITAVTLSKTKGDIQRAFWGDTVEIDEGAELTWMRQPHYYMGLYPYTYAAGLTASTAVAQAIQEEGQPAVDRWLQCLKAGGTRKPLELMKMAGVDMSQPEPIRKAVAYVGSLVDELEQTYL